MLSDLKDIDVLFLVAKANGPVVFAAILSDKRPVLIFRRRLMPESLTFAHQRSASQVCESLIHDLVHARIVLFVFWTAEHFKMPEQGSGRILLSGIASSESRDLEKNFRLTFIIRQQSNPSSLLVPLLEWSSQKE